MEKSTEQITSITGTTTATITASIIPRTIAPPVPFQGWHCGAMKSTTARKPSGVTPAYLDSTDHHLTAVKMGDVPNPVSYIEQEFDE